MGFLRQSPFDFGWLVHVELILDLVWLEFVSTNLVLLFNMILLSAEALLPMIRRLGVCVLAKSGGMVPAMLDLLLFLNSGGLVPIEHLVYGRVGAWAATWLAVDHGPDHFGDL